MSGYPNYPHSYYPQSQPQMQAPANLYAQQFTPQQPAQAPQQPQAQQSNNNSGYTCKPVTSREEAVSAPTNYLGAGDISVDLSHGMIYLKRFNRQTGGSDFFDFRVFDPSAVAQPVQQPQQPTQDYVYAATFNSVIGNINDELTTLRAELEAMRGKKKGKAGDEP